MSQLQKSLHRPMFKQIDNYFYDCRGQFSPLFLPSRIFDTCQALPPEINGCNVKPVAALGGRLGTFPTLKPDSSPYLGKKDPKMSKNI